jgi:uncharacterized membrane protein
MESTRLWIEMAAVGIESLAVAIMVGFIVIVTVRWLIQLSQKTDRAYESYRAAVGKSLLVGLELLVAADIIRTVALDTSLLSVGILSALVLIRTFLGWTLTLDIEGHWPWQSRAAPAERQSAGVVHTSDRERTRDQTEA